MSELPRNLFEIENARNMTVDELVTTFVPTPSFWRLLNGKNHVILGSRGSGKTALAKMLSHHHLSKWQDPQASELVKSAEFIGIFLPTSIEWVGSQTNKPWRNESELEMHFVWHTNISACSAALVTMRSCIDTYVESDDDKIKVEIELCKKISHKWSEGAWSSNSISRLHQKLRQIQEDKRLEIAKRYCLSQDLSFSTGAYFYMDIFSPVRSMIYDICEVLQLPADAKWVIIIDEAEFLLEQHYRILNSCMRADSGELAFKITTMPYHHKTLQTNLALPLNEGHDFEYVHIDDDPVPWTYNSINPGYIFASALFKKRASKSLQKENISIVKLLGESPLLGGIKSSKKDFPAVLDLVHRYCTDKTIAYAERLYAKDLNVFDSAIYRKLHGVLRMRSEIEKEAKGRTESFAYSGYQMVLRCGDGNPRKLIRLFNMLLRSVTKKRLHDAHVSPAINFELQNKLLIEFSSGLLDVLHSENDVGPELYTLITQIGEHLKKRFTEDKLSTNTYYSIEVGPGISDTDWKKIQYAVGLGHLQPNINPKKPARLPVKSGTFRLSYSLAPHFRLFPRRAESVPLDVILMTSLQADQHRLPIKS